MWGCALQEWRSCCARVGAVRGEGGSVSRDSSPASTLAWPRRLVARPTAVAMAATMKGTAVKRSAKSDKQPKMTMKTKKDAANNKKQRSTTSTVKKDASKKVVSKQTAGGLKQTVVKKVVEKPMSMTIAEGSAKTAWGGFHRKTWKMADQGWQLRSLQVDVMMGVVREEWVWC